MVSRHWGVLMADYMLVSLANVMGSMLQSITGFFVNMTPGYIALMTVFLIGSLLALYFALFREGLKDSM